jgi:hypothetical protein
LAGGSSRFSVEMVVVSTSVTDENVPGKITRALPSYPYGYGAYSGLDETGNVIETHEQAGEFRDW